MNLIPWRNKRDQSSATVTPEYPLTRLRNEMDRTFERFWHDPWGSGFGDLFTSQGGLGLKVDLAETDNDVVITAEVPGVDPKNIDIDVSGHTLTIRGEKKQEKEEKEKDYHYIERSYGSFHRSIQLPSSVDPAKVDASYKNGLLTVTLAKHAEARPKRIEVKHE